MLILLGGAVLRISSGDIFLRYVKQGMRPFLLATGLLLVMLGVWALVDLIRSSGQAQAPVGVTVVADDDGHGHGPGHGHGQLRIAWLLLLPVLAILLIAPPALGAYTAEREQAVVLAPVAAFDPLPAGNPVSLLLSDYAVRAVWDDQESLAGHNFELTGFVTPSGPGKKSTSDPTAPWFLTRLALTCCAADAVATKIAVVGANGLPANTWVTITGTWVPSTGQASNASIPLIKVTSIKTIAAPNNPYE